MSAEQINSQYPAEYEKVEALLPGQSVSWLKTLREQALDFFSSHGLLAYLTLLCLAHE
jgi:hypothetical protein